MKRTSKKQLEKKLGLVQTVIRPLNTDDMGTAHGGRMMDNGDCYITRTGCTSIYTG